jgi:hypothetical protein
LYPLILDNPNEDTDSWLIVDERPFDWFPLSILLSQLNTNTYLLDASLLKATVGLDIATTGLSGGD